MRAAVLREGRMVVRDDVPEPIPGPGQVLVGVTACGICGSDLHFAKHAEDVVALSAEMTGLSGGGGARLDLSTQAARVGRQYGRARSHRPG